jgi:hypothetical protein
MELHLRLEPEVLVCSPLIKPFNGLPATPANQGFLVLTYISAT